VGARESRAPSQTMGGGVADLGEGIVARLQELLVRPRPRPDEVDAARGYLEGLLPERLGDYLAALEELAAPLRPVARGLGIPDPDDRVRAVRFSLALHVLEQAVVGGRVPIDDVPNELHAELATLEETLIQVLPPKAGFGTPPAPRSI
jgi:hypothetical protein